MLCLSALAKDKEVIVSRGELVEIGGSFRVPEIMEQSGARLMDVGTTNKTKPSDYLNAYHEGEDRRTDEGPYQQLQDTGLHPGGGTS